MGYITVAHRKILRQLDSISYFPNGWDKFVKNQAIHHNLIIKSSKNQCYCTNCHTTFISTNKVNEVVKINAIAQIVIPHLLVPKK